MIILKFIELSINKYRPTTKHRRLVHRTIRLKQQESFMSTSMEMQIVKAEELLKLAMLQSDVNALDELLAPELIFTNHLGHLMTKHDDINAHKSGTLKIEVLTPSEERIQLIGDIAIVTVRVYVSGFYADTRSEGNFRFTRVWARNSGDTWHVVVAHSSAVSG